MPLRILGSRLDSVTSSNAIDQIRSFLRSDQPHHIITGNTLMVLASEHDAELREILEYAALVVPESSGLFWASKLLHEPLEEFIPGIDLMLKICGLAEAEQHPIFLLGSAPGVAEEAGLALQRDFPRIQLAGCCHGYFQVLQEPAVLEMIRQANPRALFVGMGMPAQEKWIARNLQALGVPVVMGVGGSFDVLSGRLKRAPAWMQRAGIEWVYRMAQQPWRWRRIAQLPVFAWKVLREKQHGKW